MDSPSGSTTSATPPSPPESHDVSTYVKDGAHIAGILLAWGVVAVFFAFGVSEFGSTGSLFETWAPRLGLLFGAVGLFNALLFVCYRVVDYWYAYRA
jgi:hypothetical protein